MPYPIQLQGERAPTQVVKQPATFESFNHQEALQILLLSNELWLIIYIHIFFKLGFTPCKAEQPLQGMVLQEKETQKD